MATTLTTFPQAGTHADNVRNYILANPGTTKNGILKGLDMNPGVLKKVIPALLEAGLITDEIDERKFHHYSAKNPVL